MAEIITSTIVTFRYVIGPSTVFSEDAEISMENAIITVNGVPVEGAKVKSVSVVDGGRGLELTVSVPDSMFGEVSIQ